ncbi:MAG TPA: amidohydrolase [Halomonas sp.]|nr:amidohydrolase [Halomonas sp.]
MTTSNQREALIQGVEELMPHLSEWNQTIWHYAETAWREYRSARFYVDLLREHGFTVEEGSGGMPTAFCATWSNGEGPTLGGYAEYDAVPGNCQAADVVQRPRDGLSPWAGGHTDPHSALGIGSLGGFLATQALMKAQGIGGTLKFFGEPAEKVRGSKPIHAAQGYYDDLDAAISFHPFYMLPLCNTTRWDTHCGAAYGVIYRFVCDSPETWLTSAVQSPIAASHASARAPGANDAVTQMYLNAKALREHVLASGLNWSMNEAILNAGQATADNLPAQMAEIQYFIRVSSVEQAEHVVQGLDHIAENVAQLTHCRVERHWVAKSRPGLANHALAELTYRNLERVGAPRLGDEAVALARQIQENLGMTPMERPFLADVEQLRSPQEAEHELRQILAPSQTHFTSDDYTEYSWHAPTVRLYIGRPALAPREDGKAYPAWVMNALGGLAPCIDPMIATAAKTVGLTLLDLFQEPAALEKARAEFVERTGGGIGGERWMAPLCDYEPPLQFRWPEYVTTPRGEHDWVIPASDADARPPKNV